MLSVSEDRHERPPQIARLDAGLALRTDATGQAVRPDRCTRGPTAFVRNQQGATAVEFGLVALPFLAMLGAIVQFTFMIWAQQSLDAAFQKVVRTVLTGQFQTANDQSTGSTALLAALKANMCAATAVTVFDCSGVRLDVRLGSSFASSTAATPIDPATKDWASGFGSTYACAPPGTIVVATAAVKFPVFFSLLNTGVSNFADGSKLLQSTQVFRTEPYGTSTC